MSQELNAKYHDSSINNSLFLFLDEGYDDQHKDLTDPHECQLELSNGLVKATLPIVFCWIDIYEVILVDKVFECEENASKQGYQRRCLRKDKNDAIDGTCECNVETDVEVPIVFVQAQRPFHLQLFLTELLLFPTEKERKTFAGNLVELVADIKNEEARAKECTGDQVGYEECACVKDTFTCTLNLIY